MHLTPEQEAIGRDNFAEAVGKVNRREFLAGTAAVGAGAGAMYFGYGALNGPRVKTGFIGTGDEGSVLITEHPPEYMEIVAIADARPSNRELAFKGHGISARVGLEKKLGPEVAKDIAVFNSAEELLADKDLGIEAVVIAVPLNMHAPLAIKAMEAGKHVLCEKLMAKTVADCKAMIRTARKTNKLLAVGHQRHYSVLYDNANHLLERGLLGDIKYIRAQWHRNNSFPGRDSWRKPKNRWPKEDMVLEGKTEQFGYTDLDALINWRLYNETGGGLMAELGSHQMDAASIFLGKKDPIAVQGFGGKNFYGIPGVGPKDKWTDDREIWDQIFVTYEFPGKHYNPEVADLSRDKCVVTYSSINTNRFEPYGELVYGTRGTLIMKAEKEALLWKEQSAGGGGGPDQRLVVIDEGDAAGPVMEAYETTAPVATGSTAGPAAPEDISRGYTEEMQHFCYAIREFGDDPYPGGQPIPPEKGGLRCNGLVAMADAIMALTANLAMKHSVRVPFREEWFDPETDATPEEAVPKMVGTATV